MNNINEPNQSQKYEKSSLAAISIRNWKCSKNESNIL